MSLRVALAEDAVTRRVGTSLASKVYPSPLRSRQPLDNLKHSAWSSTGPQGRLAARGRSGVPPPQAGSRRAPTFDSSRSASSSVEPDKGRSQSRGRPSMQDMRSQSRGRLAPSRGRTESPCATTRRASSLSRCTPNPQLRRPSPLKVHGDARIPRRCYSEWSSVPGSAEHMLEAAPAGKASSSSTSTGTNVTASDPSTEDPWDNVDAHLHAEVESLRQALCHVNRCVAETMVEVRLNRSLIEKSEKRQELEAPQLEQVLESLAEENKRLQQVARSEWATARRAQGTLRTMEESTDDQYRALQEKHKRLELDNSRLRKELSAMNARVLGWRQMKRRVGKERRMWQTPPRSRSDHDTQLLAYVHERSTSCSSSSRVLDSHTPETAYHDVEKEPASLELRHSDTASSTSLSAESRVGEPLRINLLSTLVPDDQSETFSCEKKLPVSQGNCIVDDTAGTELQLPSQELESAGHLHHLSDWEGLVPPPTPSSSRHIDDDKVPKGCLPLVAQAVLSPSRLGDRDLESTSTLPNQLSAAGDPLRLLPAVQDISRIQMPDSRCRSPSPASRSLGINSEVQFDLGTVHHCNSEVLAPVESGTVHHCNSEVLAPEEIGTVHHCDLEVLAPVESGTIHYHNSDELDVVQGGILLCTGSLHHSNSEDLDLTENCAQVALEEKSQPNATKVGHLSALAQEAAEVSASARARAQAALLGHGFTKAPRVSSPAAASRSSSVASSGDPAPVLSRRPSGEGQRLSKGTPGNLLENPAIH